MNILVIPDVHLKPDMLYKAKGIMAKKEELGIDKALFLGDFVDDWGQEQNIELYNETFDVLEKFIKKYPESLICWGNHDMSYVWERLESGYSSYARETVVNRIDVLKELLPRENFAFIHKIDNVLFSHGGLILEFIEKYFSDIPDKNNIDLDNIISKINKMGMNELWNDISPLWARPQYDGIAFPFDIKQVVGHTPVAKPILSYETVLTLDVFSTYRDGTPIGNEKFVYVDTITGDYRIL